MFKKCISTSLFLMLPGLLCGCGVIGSKSFSLSVVYAACAVVSLILLCGYCLFERKKDGFFLLLLSSVLIVNSGYFSLSVSRSLEEALLANRISYIGSVLLPFSMLMSILDLTHIRRRKWMTILLLCISLAVFAIAATPGYCDIYYREATIAHVNGITVLRKVYGPWHSLYLFYLLGYFAVMVGVIGYSALKKKAASPMQAIVLALAVLVNICIWLIEQLVMLDLEFLSISYIISVLFLLSIHKVLHDREPDVPPPVPEELPPCEAPLQPAEVPAAPSPAPDTTAAEDRCPPDFSALTMTERTICTAYLAGKSTREIMSELNITENTLKFHNKNLYGKLSVSSRRQLMERYGQSEPQQPDTH